MCALLRVIFFPSTWEKGINVGTDWHFNWSSRDKGVKLEKKKKTTCQSLRSIYHWTNSWKCNIYIFIPVGNAFKLTAFASNISFQVKATLSRYTKTDKSSDCLPSRSNKAFFQRGSFRRSTNYARNAFIFSSAIRERMNISKNIEIVVQGGLVFLFYQL